MRTVFAILLVVIVAAILVSVSGCATDGISVRVIDRQVSDTPIKTQITVHAVVSGTLTEPGLRQVLGRLYDRANARRGFKHHGGKPTHVAVWLYTSEDAFKSGMGQWIANLQKIGEGAWPEITIKAEVLGFHNAGPQVKHDLSELKRKEIFKELIAASDRAEAEADRMYPWPRAGESRAIADEKIRKNAEALEVLREKYKSEVAKSMA